MSRSENACITVHRTTLTLLQGPKCDLPSQVIETWVTIIPVPELQDGATSQTRAKFFKQKRIYIFGILITF